jgi:tripartite-type tricarboxylate transporter receptor subunit TctC
MRKILIGTLVAVGAASGATAVTAQNYPARSITIIAGVPPGGVVDWMARAMGQKLQERWGQSVVVENRPGASGWIALQALQKAPADGHTLFAYANVGITMELFVKGASFVPGKNVQPLTPAFWAPYVVITNTQVPARSLKEFVAHAKANPGKLNFASAGGFQALDSYWLLRQAGMDMVIVNYQGGAAALRALMANETQAYLGAVFGLEQQVKAGKITALAVTSARRFPSLPDIPTVKEAIGADMDATVQYGYFTTFGTPRPVIDRLVREMTDVVLRSDMNEQIRKQGYDPITSTPEEWARGMLEEVRRARLVAEQTGVKPE